MNIREILAANLRRMRRERGLSQEELAHRANIHRTYVSSLERCQYSATIDLVDNLAVVLGVETPDLLKFEHAGGQEAPRDRDAFESDPS
jgi:transcriptional regulator with XRE-family HTH domain